MISCANRFRGEDVCTTAPQYVGNENVTQERQFVSGMLSIMYVVCRLLNDHLDQSNLLAE